jgi:hypothetical protein
MRFWKIRFRQLIHKVFFFSKVRRRNVDCIDKGIGPFRVVWSKSIRLVPYVGAG